jgi:hypothetical protein
MNVKKTSKDIRRVMKKINKDIRRVVEIHPEDGFYFRRSSFVGRKGYWEYKSIWEENSNSASSHASSHPSVHPVGYEHGEFVFIDGREKQKIHFYAIKTIPWELSVVNIINVSDISYISGNEDSLKVYMKGNLNNYFLLNGEEARRLMKEMLERSKDLGFFLLSIKEDKEGVK